MKFNETKHNKLKREEEHVSILSKQIREVILCVCKIQEQYQKNTKRILEDDEEEEERENKKKNNN